MNKILAIILALGIFLRVFDIHQNPRALYGDELTLVYDAYSILKTGYDQRGNFLPITFEMAGGRPGGYVYATIPFVAIFGPNELAARSVSILSGVGIILLIFLLGKRLFNGRVGLVAAGLMSISPWSLALSRGGFETHFALFLVLLGIVGFIEGLKKPRLFLISAVVFGLSIHTYSTYKLTTPLIVLLLICFAGVRKLFSNEYRRYILASAFILALFGGILFLQITSGSEKRFLSTNVFNQAEKGEQIVQRINLDRQLNSLPNPLSSLFHNKAVEYTTLIGSSYLKNLSTEFLFIKGDSNPRHNPAQTGGLYLVEVVTLLLGLVFLLTFDNKIVSKFLIGWVLIAPTATALLLEPHALRSSLLLPPLLLISAVGFLYLWNLPKKYPSQLIKFGLIIALIGQFLFVINRIYFLSPNEFSRFWSYPAKSATSVTLQESSNYKYIILSDRIDNIEFAYPVYAKVDPQNVLQQNRQNTYLSNLPFKKYGNVYIGYIPDSAVLEFTESLDGSSLYIGPSQDSKFLKDFDTTLGLDGQPALVLKRLEVAQ